jgi:uncharacterized lipoprotein YajG
MPVYATHRDPTFGAVVPPQLFALTPESLMSRRQLSLVVVTIASLIVTACAAPTAPQASPKAGAPSFDAVADSLARIGTTESHG